MIKYLQNEQLEDWIKTVVINDPEWVKLRRLEYLYNQIKEINNWINKSFGLLETRLTPKLSQIKREIAHWESPKALKGEITNQMIENAKNAVWEAIEPESKPAGPNRRKVKCPFHEEKTASMVLYEGNGYHCYGCQAHGDTIDYVMKRDNLEFKEAVKSLN